MGNNYICKKCGNSEQEPMKCKICGSDVVLVAWQEYKAIKHAYHLVGYKNPLKEQ